MSESISKIYNRKLAREFLVKKKVYSRYPRVSEQVECFPIAQKLFRHGYNPTINASGWMVYRFHPTESKSTRLALATANESVELNMGGKSEEDPKLFTFQGEQYLSWVESNYPEKMSAVVKFGRFSNGLVKDIVQPDIGTNDGSSVEKNWVFFESQLCPHLVYQCSPTHSVIRLGYDDPITYESAAPEWPYGAIKGGTAPLPYEGKLLRFFHSRSDTELSSIYWRYFVGAYLMEPEPPFAVIRVSKKPIIYGSELDSLTPTQRKECHHRKLNVVFPGGAIEKDGGWTLALGENDAACLLVIIKPEQLNF